jgi:hypothetical protein
MAVYLLRLRMEGSLKYVDWVVADSQQKVIRRRAGLTGDDYLLPFKN